MMPRQLRRGIHQQFYEALERQIKAIDEQLARLRRARATAGM